MKASTMRREILENCPPRMNRRFVRFVLCLFGLTFVAVLSQSAFQSCNNRTRDEWDEGVLCDISERSNKGAKSKRPIVEPEERTIQICFDFTKGRCSRRNCKFSHDYDAIVKYNSKEQGICFDFLRGECNRGPLCRFSHDLSNVMKQWTHELRVGNTSRFTTSGICYDFVRGQCPRGKKCRFSHDLREIAMVTSRQGNENQNTSPNKSNHVLDRDGPNLSTKTPNQAPNFPSCRFRNPRKEFGTLQENGVRDSTHCGMNRRPQEAKSIWRSSNDLNCALQKTQLMNYKNMAQLRRALPNRKQKDHRDNTLPKPTRLPLSNIRSRALLGTELCQAMGIPSLKSSLTFSLH